MTKQSKDSLKVDDNHTSLNQLDRKDLRLLEPDNIIAQEDSFAQKSDVPKSTDPEFKKYEERVMTFLERGLNYLSDESKRKVKDTIKNLLIEGRVENMEGKVEAAIKDIVDEEKRRSSEDKAIDDSYGDLGDYFKSDNSNTSIDLIKIITKHSMAGIILSSIIDSLDKAITDGFTKDQEGDLKKALLTASEKLDGKDVLHSLSCKILADYLIDGVSQRSKGDQIEVAKISADVTKGMCEGNVNELTLLSNLMSAIGRSADDDHKKSFEKDFLNLNDHNTQSGLEDVFKMAGFSSEKTLDGIVGFLSHIGDEVQHSDVGKAFTSWLDGTSKASFIAISDPLIDRAKIDLNGARVGLEDLMSGAMDKSAARVGELVSRDSPSPASSFSTKAVRHLPSGIEAADGNALFSAMKGAASSMLGG